MTSDSITLIFQFLILLFSVIIHEISHGFMAERLGDPTARLAGRLTLNPIPHLSLFGMVLMPLLTYFAWGVPVGAAKPVPYNPSLLSNKRWGEVLVSLAGPLSNLCIAIVFGLFSRSFGFFASAENSFLEFRAVLGVVVFINVWLAVFNMIPIPPIDGSKVFFGILPRMYQRSLALFWHRIRPMATTYWYFLILLFVLFGGYLLSFVLGVIEPIAEFLFTIILG